MILAVLGRPDFLTHLFKNTDHSGLKGLLHQQIGSPGLVKQR